MSQVKCPYCDSIQVKAMANQPKKYPKPTDPAELADWQRGYDCKKCGNDFIVVPPKPLGFFTKLCGWIILGLIALFLYSAFTSPSKDSTSATQEAAPDPVIEEAAQDEVLGTTSEENPLDQEFSQEAEEAAHTPYFDEPTSIENSTDQNDTLSIKTTLRAKD